MRAAFATIAFAAAAVADVPPYNLVERLQLVPDMSTLVTAVVAGGLAPTLSGKGPFTVFAPDNRAFEALPPGVLPHLLANKTLLDEILTYHVVAGNVSSKDLKDGPVKTVQGDNIDVLIDPAHNNFPARVILNKDAIVTYADNYATNGVFHIIDHVLVPRPLSKALSALFYPVAAPTLNLVQRLQLIPYYSTLVSAVVAGGLVETLSGKGPFTLFTPSNRAFEALPPGAIEKLLANKTLLDEVLTYHAVAGAVYSSALKNGENVTTINGEDIAVTIDTANGHELIILDERKGRGGSFVVEPNNTATNGVFHGVTGVLIPPHLNAVFYA